MSHSLPNQAPRSWRTDLPIVALLLLAIVVQLALAGGERILERHLWLDEIHTYTLVADSDLSHSLQALRRGVDYNPPALFLLQRGVSCAWGGVHEWTLRGLSLVSALLAVAALFLCLRTVVRPWVAVAASLTLWIHPVVAEHAFEARFYAPWCAALAWFCWFHLQLSAGRRLLGGVGMCLTACLVCTLHYFGVISLALYGAAYAAANPRSVFREAWLWVSGACGLGALLACLPFYREQKAALSISTWILPPNAERIAEFLGIVTPIFVLTICGVIGWYELRSRAEQGREPSPTGGWRRLSGLFGQLAMPPVLIVFSYVVQPVLMPRYAIVAALGFAAAAAWLLAQVRPQAAVLASVFWLGFGGWQMALYSDLVQQEDEQRQQLFAVLREDCEQAPVVFESRLDLYPVRHYAADLWPRSSLLDFEDGQIRGFAPKRIVERDVGRRFAEQYPEQFRLTRFSDLPRLGRFFLVVLPDKTNAGPDYQGFAVRQVGERVFELTAEQSAAGPSADMPSGQRSVSQRTYSVGNP